MLTIRNAKPTRLFSFAGVPPTRSARTHPVVHAPLNRHDPLPSSAGDGRAAAAADAAHAAADGRPRRPGQADAHAGRPRRGRVRAARHADAVPDAPAAARLHHAAPPRHAAAAPLRAAGADGGVPRPVRPGLLHAPAAGYGRQPGHPADQLPPPRQLPQPPADGPPADDAEQHASQPRRRPPARGPAAPLRRPGGQASGGARLGRAFQCGSVGGRRCVRAYLRVGLHADIKALTRPFPTGEFGYSPKLSRTFTDFHGRREESAGDENRPLSP
eukprot:641972-Pyramimonas_sp.AAC.1